MAHKAACSDDVTPVVADRCTSSLVLMRLLPASFRRVALPMFRLPGASLLGQGMPEGPALGIPYGNGADAEQFQAR